MIEHDGCLGCKYEMCPEDSKECTNCKQNAIDKYIPRTVYDKIREMNDAELDAFLALSDMKYVIKNWKGGM